MDNATEDILTLLAVTVLADKRVFAKEIEAFITASKSLCRAANISPKMTEPRALSWFEINKERIRSNMTHADFEAWFTKLLQRITRLKSSKDFLAEMQKIAKADDEVHVSETALMVLVRQQLESNWQPS